MTIDDFRSAMPGNWGQRFTGNAITRMITAGASVADASAIVDAGIGHTTYITDRESGMTHDAAMSRQTGHNVAASQERGVISLPADVPIVGSPLVDGQLPTRPSIALAHLQPDLRLACVDADDMTGSTGRQHIVQRVEWDPQDGDGARTSYYTHPN